MRHPTQPSCSTASIVAVVGLLLALAVLLPATALATTVLKMDLEALVGTAEAVVVGQVVAQEAIVEEGKVYTVTTVRIDELLKGDASTTDASTADPSTDPSTADRGQQTPGPSIDARKAPDKEQPLTLTIKQIGGRTRTLATHVPGMPSFEVGEEVVLFAERPKQLQHFVITGLSQGKFHIALGPDSATKVVVPRLGDVSLVERIQAISPPVSEEQVGTLQQVDPSILHRGVVPLDEFTGQIRELVENDVSQPSQ